LDCRGDSKGTSMQIWVWSSVPKALMRSKFG
jgi:hypothetical protein